MTDWLLTETMSPLLAAFRVERRYHRLLKAAAGPRFRLSRSWRAPLAPIHYRIIPEESRNGSLVVG
jgi:hypothetical protein